MEEIEQLVSKAFRTWKQFNFTSFKKFAATNTTPASTTTTMSRLDMILVTASKVSMCTKAEVDSGYSVFTHYTSARRWYAPQDMANINDSKIERVTEMGIKKNIDI